MHTVGVQEMCFDRGARGQPSANTAPGNFRAAFLPNLRLILFGFGIFFFCQQNTLSSSLPKNGASLGPGQSLLPALFVLLLNLAEVLGLGVEFPFFPI